MDTTPKLRGSRGAQYCCVCSNYRGKVVDGRKISLHRFPADPKIGSVWRKQVSLVRKDFVPNQNHRLCSEHFVGRSGPTKLATIPSLFLSRKIKTSVHFKDGWPSEENPDPLSAIASENDQPKKRKLPLKRSQPPPPKTRKLTAARILDSLGVAPEQGLLPNEELSEVAPQQGLLPIEEPSEVKRKCDEEAEATVSKICQTVFSSRKTAKNERVLQLVKGLTSLMLQIRTFSESDFNSFEFRSLQDSLKEIKETLDTNNINSFQNNVEIHISHIESWLSQMGNVHASAASMQDT